MSKILEKKKLISKPSRRVQKWWTIHFESLEPKVSFGISAISGHLRPKKLLASEITNKTVKRGTFFFYFAFPKSIFIQWKSCTNQKSFYHIISMTSNYVLRGKSSNSVKIVLLPRADCVVLPKYKSTCWSLEKTNIISVTCIPLSTFNQLFWKNTYVTKSPWSAVYHP